MKFRTKHQIHSARKEVEKSIGAKIPKSVADDVLDYCIRKLSYINKDESYLPILYRCELPIHLQIREINSNSKICYSVRT